MAVYYECIRIVDCANNAFPEQPLSQTELVALLWLLEGFVYFRKHTIVNKGSVFYYPFSQVALSPILEIVFD
jgi:hypothetical protein